METSTSAGRSTRKNADAGREKRQARNKRKIQRQRLVMEIQEANKVKQPKPIDRAFRILQRYGLTVVGA